MKIKFGFTQGLNVARLGLDETQIMTACQMADRMNYDSVWMMDHSNVPQWKNAVVNDAWLMLSAIGAVTHNVELGSCVTDAIRRHPSTIAQSTITLDRITKGRSILGIGAGEAQNVVDFGIEFEKPVTKFKEQLEVIEKLFDSDPDNRVNYDGNYYKLVNACLKTKCEIACANSTSTSASVRTLAAVASANAKNQNCDASAPMNPAKSDGRH